MKTKVERAIATADTPSVSGDYSLMHKKARAARVLAREVERLTDHTCEWTYDDGWSTGCGKLWCFTEGNLEENDCIYCHFCGGKIVTKPEAGDGN